MSAATIPPLFVWKNDYSVRIEAIDAQHKQLVWLISQLHGAMMQGKANDVLAETLGKLIRYTETHFADEEKMLRETGYPHLSAHVSEHRRLTASARKLYDDFATGKAAITIETLHFLKTWLNDHILGMDQQYAKFLQEKGKR